MLAGETPKDFSLYVVVWPLALAQKTVSGYESIDRLTNIAALQEQGLPAEQIAAQEAVEDSQVIVYAGGVAEGNNVIRLARKNFTSGKLGVWHPFNVAEFNSEQSQGRPLFAGYDDNVGLDGISNLNFSYGRFAGVAPEALALLQLREAPQKITEPSPPLENLVADSQGLLY